MMKYQLIENPKESEINLVRHRLQDHNRPFWEVDDRKTNEYLLKDGTNLIGGIVFTIFGEWMEIDFFWVDTGYRGRGYGKQILEKAERFAGSHSCRRSFLNTFNFQAKPFYEKLGYKVVYTQCNFPVTNTRYFMEKELKLMTEMKLRR